MKLLVRMPNRRFDAAQKTGLSRVVPGHGPVPGAPARAVAGRLATSDRGRSRRQLSDEEPSVGSVGNGGRSFTSQLDVRLFWEAADADRSDHVTVDDDRYAAAPPDVARVSEVRDRKALRSGALSQDARLDAFAGRGERLVDRDVDRREAASVRAQERDELAVRVDDGDGGAATRRVELLGDESNQAPSLGGRDLAAFNSHHFSLSDSVASVQAPLAWLDA